MQSRLPVSKPLALVIIGLIIGTSLGLGSGYAIFYPDMVNERSKTVEERIVDIEGNVTSLDQRIIGINQSINVINENLEGILALTEVVQGINERVSALENGQININSDINDLEDTLTDIEDDLDYLATSWDDVLEEFSDLETAYNSVNNELEDIQALVRETDGITILTAYMASPSSNFEQKISNQIYTLLVAEESDFADWVALYGETTAKLLLQQEVDSMMGNLVWNPTANTEVGTDSYQVKLETYFTFEFDPAGVKVNNMHLEIKATVDIDDGAISSLSVTSIEIV